MTRPAVLPAQFRLTPDPALVSLVQSARFDINRFWASQVPNYLPPADVVMVQVPTTTDCGPFPKPNARYCGSTNKIYWDLSLFASQYKIGDFAPVFILAHEWGHLVQSLMGFDRTARGLMTIQLELQADCLAGTYASDARSRKVLDDGDDDEAALALRRAGDSFDGDWFDKNAHGTPGQRIDAFTYGFEGRSCTANSFFDFLKVRGVDPARAPQSVPTQGSLDALIPRQAGRFTMTAVTREHMDGATDYLKATYRTNDGIDVKLAVLAFSDAQTANDTLASVVGILNEKGIPELRRVKVVNDAKTQIGTEVVLHGQLETVVWTNKHVLGKADGPFDVTLELCRALPF
ncbi:MAG: neutral zinc metallopeptidase [Acidobacteriota bacterium]